MKAAAACVLFACLLIVHVQGQAKTNARRCLCRGPGANFIHPKRIDRVEIYPPSASCENVEMIVVLKNGAGKKCLNLESEFVKNYVKRAQRLKRSQLKETQ